MPLIRYDFGDLAEVGAPCPCGRTLPTVSRFVGRARDMPTLPDGSRRYPYCGHNAMMEVTAIRQVVQKSTSEIEMRLVLSRSLTAEEETHIRAVAIEGLGHPFAITLTRVNEIHRSALGKYAEFSSELAGYLPKDRLVLRRRRRRSVMPSALNPATIIIHVAGSGMAGVTASATRKGKFVPLGILRFGPNPMREVSMNVKPVIVPRGQRTHLKRISFPIGDTTASVADHEN